MNRKLILLAAIALLILIKITWADERLVTQDTTTGKFKADTTPTGTGVLTVDGLTMGNDEYVTFGVDTLHWDSITHDFRLSDDLYLEDIHPGLVFSTVDGEVGAAYALHFHYGTQYPFALWYGTIDENSAFVGGGFPLLYADADYVYFPNGIGGAVKMVDMKTGATQAAAGAVTDELWADDDDGYTVKLGQ